MNLSAYGLVEHRVKVSTTLSHMACAMIAQAAKDLVSKNSKLRNGARAWVEDDSQQGLFCLERCCEYITDHLRSQRRAEIIEDLDPRVVRATLLNNPGRIARARIKLDLEDSSRGEESLDCVSALPAGFRRFRQTALSME